MTDDRVVVVQGLFRASPAGAAGGSGDPRGRRASLVADHGEALGVLGYEWVDGGAKKLANRLSRLARGTARPVEAAETIGFDEATLGASLGDPSARARLAEVLGCERIGFDPDRSFVLVGSPRLLVDGPASGQRVLWFGRGPDDLDEARFMEHYTRVHGPLVAGHAPALGLNRYVQVPRERPALGAALGELGAGRGPAPPVFAELWLGRVPLDPAGLLARRRATREIRIDERRHIDFRRSMLLLA